MATIHDNATKMQFFSLPDPFFFLQGPRAMAEAALRVLPHRQHPRMLHSARARCLHVSPVPPLPTVPTFSFLSLWFLIEY